VFDAETPHEPNFPWWTIRKRNRLIQEREVMKGHDVNWTVVSVHLRKLRHCALGGGNNSVCFVHGPFEPLISRSKLWGMRPPYGDSSPTIMNEANEAGVIVRRTGTVYPVAGC
jgi:hypothetical protein